MHLRLYDQFKYKYHTLEAIEIDDTIPECSKTEQLDLNNDVIIVEAPTNLPPDGVFIKPPLIISNIYYAPFSSVVGCPWVKFILQKITTVENNKRLYEVTPVNQKAKAKHKIRTISGNDIAYAMPASVKLPVGSRIIAVYTYTNTATANRRIFYAGIVAESPSALNNYRYLIFFDDGYARYVEFDLVYPVVESSVDVWDDINGESKAFIKKYLMSYPDRPMVKFKRQQKVSTEYSGK